MWILFISGIISLFNLRAKYNQRTITKFTFEKEYMNFQWPFKCYPKIFSSKPREYIQVLLQNNVMFPEIRCICLVAKGAMENVGFAKNKTL